MKFAFFGTPDISVTALDEMEKLGFIPSLVVCNPDAPVGRKHVITPPPVKVWAEAREIPVFQPDKLPKEPQHNNDGHPMSIICDTEWDMFVVFAYGKIIPQWLLDMPKHGTINAHPSLLPKFRGASPIRSTLLNDLSACGVTIIQMDQELDHGPILLQEPYPLSIPILGRKLDTILAKKCGSLLVQAIEDIEVLEPTSQDHSLATFCTKITKDMAELDINPYDLPTGDEALAMYHKICAFDGWPSTFFFHKDKRIKITGVRYDDQTKKLIVTHVVPEGKKEQGWATWMKQS